MNGKNWLVLFIGVIVGVIVASVYWHKKQESSKFIFDQNVRCQKIAKQYEEDHNFRRGMLKVAYAPTRNSCVAEVFIMGDGSIDYALVDLLSGDIRIVFHRSIQNAAHDPQEVFLDQKLFRNYDAQFAKFSH